MPYSIRRFLRRQKARIRREAPDAVEAERRVAELVREQTAAYNKKKI